MGRYRETMPGWVRFGNRGAIAHQLENIAFLLIERGESLRAASLLGTGEVLRETLASPMLEPEQAEHDEWIARLRGAEGAPAIDAAMADGRAMPMLDAVALATR
jgi:hypothetical protein